MAVSGVLRALMVWYAVAALSGCVTQLPGDVSSMLDDASDSVVAVGHQGTTIGSAFALSPRRFVTSHHIASKGDVYLLDSGQRPVPATLLAADVALDIALLEAPLDAPVLTATPRAPLGSAVYALGNPFGLGLTVTRGIVSAQPRSIGKSHLLQIDAAVNPGNSGGPLVNAQGQVVSLVSSRATVGSGIAFAVPIQHVTALLERASLQPD